MFISMHILLYRLVFVYLTGNRFDTLVIFAFQPKVSYDLFSLELFYPVSSSFEMVDCGLEKIYLIFLEVAITTQSSFICSLHQSICSF